MPETTCEASFQKRHKTATCGLVCVVGAIGGVAFYLRPASVKWPRSVLRNRASFPLALISRRIEA